jgi:hypothetical protein
MNSFREKERDRERADMNVGNTLRVGCHVMKVRDQLLIALSKKQRNNRYRYMDGHD